ncbi:damage-inducible protein DinB [Paenibacillus alba]|uniref:DinB family protein n=1 Tax=Paenibacillus alba TaxID=1197127 RepID=UPI001565B4FD|nr:DinB family protein [Paenibacillus alba]NQX68728.1 damage-inducible protein DinB [Paenibacillus alba]
MSNFMLKNYNYHVWANHRVFARLAELPEETMHQELKDVFPSIHAGLVHMYRVDWVWLSGLKGSSFEEIRSQTVKIVEKMAGMTLKELEAAFIELAEDCQNFLSGVEDVQGTIRFPHPILGVLATNINEVIQHIVNHGTYHRGNISSMLRQLGHAGASSDYVFYLYEVNQVK